MAASATLLEQYSDIWIDKHDYLEAERIYYEGKLGSAVVNDLAITMGRKNKSKQSAAPSTVAPPPTPLSPLPNDSPVPASVIPSEPVPKGPQGGKGKSNKGQAAKPVQQQTPKHSSPQLSGDVCPLVDGTQTIAPSSCPSTSPDSSTKNKGAQTSKTEAQGSSSNKSNMKPAPSTLAEEVAKAQEHLKKSLECMDGIAKLSGDSPALLKKISALETENKSFKKDIQDLTSLVKKLELRLSSLESSSGGGKTPATPTPKATPASSAAPANDDDVDLFGSDSEEESEEAAKIREERLAAYNAKKSKKPVLIAKSNIILDVKPWGDDTDMKAMETQVRAIAMDGLLWGASKLAPLAYGINKLQISCVVEDDLVSVDALQEAIQDIEEYVQSVDIAAFNKV